MNYPESASTAGPLANPQLSHSTRCQLLDLFYDLMFGIVWLFAVVFLVLQIT